MEGLGSSLIRLVAVVLAPGDIRDELEKQVLKIPLVKAKVIVRLRQPMS